MGWPISQDYNEAIQNPATSFADPDLRGGEVAVGPLGLPLPRSGNFADVYQFTDRHGGKWAIKCFTRHVPGLQERYTKIDAHLRQAKLPFSVGFQFLEQGIRVRGAWYPILKMEWVEGMTLNEFVRQSADKPNELRALLGLWVKLSARLRAAHIAHADLQHGNVLLVPGSTANKLSLKLIDYDGMWVPPLAKSPSGEAGHPAYQHPARLSERLYSADVDRFPHLVIACALRATALGGKKLWQTFDNGDNLLFREADLAHPGQSKLLRTLWGMDDPTVTNLTALLVLAAQRPLEDTPWVDEVLEGERSHAISDGLLAKAADLIGVERRHVRKPIPTAQLFVTTDQGNDVASAYEEMATAPLPRSRSRSRGSPLPWLLAGTVVCCLVLALGVYAIVSRQQKSNTDPAPVAKKDEANPPKPIDRVGSVETKWVKIEPGEPVLPVLALANEAADRLGETNFLHLKGSQATFGLTLSADGTQAIHAGHSVLGVTDLLDGQPRTFGKDEGPFALGAISPDGRHIVTVNRQNQVVCWHVGQRALKWTFNPPGQLTAVTITPDAKRVALCGLAIGYFEFNLETGQELRRHPLLQGQAMHFTPDGEKLVLRIGEQLECWELDQPERKGVATATIGTEAMAMSANGKEFWIAGPTQTLRRFGVPTLTPLEDYHHGRVQLATLVSLQRSTGLILSSSNGTGIVHDQTKNVLPELLPLPNWGEARRSYLTRDNRTLLMGNGVGLVVVRLGAGSGVVPKKNPTGPFQLIKMVPLPAPPTFSGFDATGKLFLTCDGKHLSVLDRKGGQLVGGYVSPTTIHAAGFTHDGRILLTEGNEPNLTTATWDHLTKNRVAWPTEGEMLTNVRPVPHDSKTNFVLVHSTKRGHLLYDTQTMLPVPKWPDSQGHIKGAVAAPDGLFIAYAHAQAPIKFWSVDNQDTRRTMEASEGALAFAFLPDGKKLVGLWPLGRLSVWDCETGKLDAEVPHDWPGPFTGLQVVGPNLVQLQREKQAILVQLDSGKVFDVSKAPPAWQLAQAIDPASETLVKPGADKAVESWRYSNKTLAELPEATKPTPLNPDLLLARDGPVGTIVGAEYSDGGSKLILATNNARLWRLNSEGLRMEKEANTTDTEWRHMVRSGSRVFTIGPKGEVRRWNVDNMEVLSSYLLGAEPVVMAARPDSETVFVATTDRKLHLLDMGRKKSNLTELLAPVGPNGRIVSQVVNTTYSSNALTAVMRWDNGSIGLWRPGDTARVKLLIDDGMKDKVAPHCLAVSPTGLHALIGTKDGYVRLWDTTVAKKPRSELAHRVDGKPDNITDVVLTTKGTHALTRGVDGKIILWNVAQFKRVKEYTSEAGPGRVRIAPDDQTFVVVTSGRVEQWKLPELTKD